MAALPAKITKNSANGQGDETGYHITMSAAAGHSRNFRPPDRPHEHRPYVRRSTARFRTDHGLSPCNGQALLQPEYAERVDRDGQDWSFRGRGLRQNLRDASCRKMSGFDRQFVGSAAMGAGKPKGRRADCSESVLVRLNAGINRAAGAGALEYQKGHLTFL